MTTCKNCRHWEPSKGGYGICQKIDYTSDWPDGARAEIHVKVADDWGLDSSLLTKPDFGCVSFEPNNPDA